MERGIYWIYPGTPRKISDDQIERVIVATLERRPEGATHWSTRMMAKKLGFSQSAISRIWRAFGLKPHRASTYTLSRDPLFVEKVRDVVGLYLHPPDRALVLCVDEKSQIQALNRYPRHRAKGFRHFLDLIDAGVPADQQVHLILDNYATHKSPTIHRPH